MFCIGFIKEAFLVETGIGALAGGEKDKHGQKKNRSIGAFRGASVGLGGGIASGLATLPFRKKILEAVEKNDVPKLKKLVPLAVGARVAAYGAGGLGAYHLAKKHGPKYDKELKAKN